MAIAIRIESVSRRFGDVLALDNVIVDIAAGEFFTLLGSSGSGKSTLLKSIGGFDRPDSGRILFDGVDVTDLPANRRPVNTVFQDLALFPHMSVAQNVGYGLRVQRVARAALDRRVAEALNLVDLGGFGDRDVNLLSGGQRQRVALARALVMEPGILLLDEPLTGLDERLREQMRDEFGRLHSRTGATFILVTHNHDEALTLSDRMAVMHRGRIEQVGTPRHFFDAPANAFVARFVGIEALLTPETIEPGGHAVIGGQRLPVAGVPAPGTLVAIRPDRLSLNYVAEGDTPLTLTIIDIKFRGLHSDFRARFLDGQEVVVPAPVDMAASLTPGDPLHLWLRPGGAVLVAPHSIPVLVRTGQVPGRQLAGQARNQT
jgi:spermidine/putrescine transport system ATP-binding protein